LKLVFVTQKEPYYIPKYLDDILNRLGKEDEAIKVYALPPNLPRKNFLQTALYYFSYFGFIVFSYMVLLRIFYIAQDFFNRYFKISKHFHSVKLVCRKHGVTFSETDRINTREILDELRRLEPDIIFSIASPQIFGRELLAIPAKGCLNIHSSLLPKYRGNNANFWALAKGEKITGVTIHYMNTEIDRGDILLQEKINIENWSLNELYLRIIDIGSDAIAKCMRIIHEDKIVTQENEISKGSYFTFPDKTAVKEFKSRKKRFFKYL